MWQGNNSIVHLINSFMENFITYLIQKLSTNKQWYVCGKCSLKNQSWECKRATSKLPLYNYFVEEVSELIIGDGKCSLVFNWTDEFVLGPLTKITKTVPWIIRLLYLNFSEFSLPELPEQAIQRMSLRQ